MSKNHSTNRERSHIARRQHRRWKVTSEAARRYWKKAQGMLRAYWRGDGDYPSDLL